MSNLLFPERRTASARRQLLSVITAAFIVLQPVLFGAPRVAAQVTPTLGSPYTQNFDTLPATGSTTWTNNSTIPGWFHARTGTGTTIVANNGSSNAGNLYSYGCTDANAPCNVSPNSTTDRALGSLGSGNAAVGNLFWGVRLQNTTGSTITSLAVSYTGEQWRNSAAAAQTVSFSYLVGSPTVTGSLAEFQSAGVAVPQLDFTSPITGGTAGALNGNLAANRVTLTHTITGLNIPNGTEIMLRWSDPDHTGADHGLAIDDFSVTANGAGPPGNTLSVNDVSQDEGNAGTTTFTFTVSLSAPAGPGGVTFDIATADGTAQDDNPATEDNDYVAQSLTGQTIPAGSSTYAFNVSVNGDTTSEPNETFFVNVTSVTGATVGDGQGQGTIVNDDITITLIHDVQGNGAASPVSGATVTVRGIVTLLKSNGFFIQEEVGDNDADPNTSEGIFVFTSSAPTVSVGDQATVTGTVVEFNGLTEISPVSNVSVNSTGNTLPTAVTLTTADLPPTANFAQPQLEKYEGMRVAAASLTTVSPNDNFFDVSTVITGQPRPLREPGIPASDPIPPDPTSGTPDPNIPIWDENPERLLVDTNGRAGATGETITSNVVITNVAGPLDFAFGQYRLVNEAALTRSANMSAIPVPTPTADEYTIASYNIENFNNNATQRQKAAQTICNVLHQPDIIGTVEIFDLADLQALAAEVQTLCGAAYSSHLVEQDGTSEDNDQDVGFLVKTSRVTVNSVSQEREEETFEEPGGGTAILHDRPPLVLDATVDPSGANPRRVLVVVNHLRSFIDIELVAGDGPRVREKRKLQAESLADLLNDLQTANPGVPVVSVGDYNAYQFSDGYTDPVATIKGNPTPDDQIVVDQSPDLVNPDFVNLIDELPAAERYSFIFEHTPQAIDHHIVNTAARARNTRTAIARVNADFPEVAAAAFASDATRPERNSDHDPVVSYYTLAQGQAAGTLIISEFRFRGPNTAGPMAPSLAPDNEFVELYNNTDADITVQTLDGSEGYAIVASDGTTLVTVPNGTVIPARGHWLGFNANGYSLSNYGGPGAGEGEDGWIGSTIPDNGGVALFRTANPAFFTMDDRLDAAGYTTAPALYREGAGLPTGGPEFDEDVAEWSFYRDFRAPGGRPVDTGNNAADFLGVSTDGAGTALGPRLGAPGPENLSSPIERNGFMQLALLDATKPAASPPNRVRDFTSDPMNNSTHGTLILRRRVVNNTGQDVTAVRFRIVNITTFPPATPGTADLRALSSSDVVISGVTDTATCAAQGDTPPCDVTVMGTILEEPPSQPNGGGWNSSLTVPVSIPEGESVNIQFVLGIQQTGAFRFYINTEVLTEAVVTELKAPALPVTRGTSRKPTARR